MGDASKFNVWSEHLDEADVAPVETLRPETALLLVLAAAHDEDCLIATEMPRGADSHEDWFVRDLGTGVITRYRSCVARSFGFDDAIELHFCRLRACRVCGCIDEQACPGGCHWVGPDLCSACVPREAA